MITYLRDRFVTQRVKLFIVGAIGLTLVGLLLYQTFARYAILQEKLQLEVKVTKMTATLEEVTKERDGLRMAISTIEKERKRTLGTVASLKMEQDRIYRTLAQMRSNLKEISDREQQCIAALAQARQYFAR